MYKKKGLPEKNDFVVCTVKKILPHSVFVDLEEYEDKEGMIHVSEIARRWIRNIKTYMKEGTKVVCKVMDVDPEKNHINLSVRRIGASQKRMKLAEWSNEKKANDILEVFAKQNKLTTKKIYDGVGNKLLEKYGLLYPVFLEVASVGRAPFDEAGVEKDLATKLTELIKKRIVPPKAEIEGLLIMSSTSSKGLEIIKSIIEKAKELAKKKKVEFEVKYLGAPKYKFKLVSDDFKTAENALKEIEELISEFMKEQDGSFELKRS